MWQIKAYAFDSGSLYNHKNPVHSLFRDDRFGSFFGHNLVAHEGCRSVILRNDFQCPTRRPIQQYP